MSGSPLPPQSAVPDMTDLESDGPQKAFVKPKNTPDDPPEFCEGDNVMVKVHVNGIETAPQMKVLKCKPENGAWVYKLECEGQPYTENQADGTVKEWFEEGRLEAV